MSLGPLSTYSTGKNGSKVVAEVFCIDPVAVSSRGKVGGVSFKSVGGGLSKAPKECVAGRESLTFLIRDLAGRIAEGGYWCLRVSEALFRGHFMKRGIGFFRTYWWREDFVALPPPFAPLLQSSNICRWVRYEVSCVIEKLLQQYREVPFSLDDNLVLSVGQLGREKANLSVQTLLEAWSSSSAKIQKTPNSLQLSQGSPPKH